MMHIIMSVFNTLSTVAYGIFASIVSFAFFYALGQVCFPKRLKKSQLSQGLVFPAFLGAAIFCFVSWHGVQCAIPLDVVFQALLIFLITVFFIRISFFKKQLIDNWRSIKLTNRFFWARNRLLPKSNNLFWFFAYILFYILVYTFLPQPDSSHYLPLTCIGNFDIFNYVDIAQYFISPHHEVLANLSYLDVSWQLYYQTPAAFYFFGWLSLFYHHNAMMVAMPLLYSAASLIGLMITYYCHHLFRCPRAVSVGIAAAVLCGSFYTYIIGLYFLPSLIGTAIWLAFLVKILRWKMVDRDVSTLLECAVVILVYQCLLLLVYPVFFTLNLGIFLGVIGMRLWCKEAQSSLAILLMGVLATITSFLCFPGYFETLLYNLNEFSHRSTILGLPLLSPMAILGLPSHFAQASQMVVTKLAVFFLFLGGLLYTLRVTRLRMEKASWMLFFIAIGSFVVYFMYYFIEGPARYQPWKFASYFMLPLAGTFWAIIFNIFTHISNNKKRSRYLFILLMGCCVMGNFFWFRLPPVAPLTKNYRHLAQLNTIPGKDICLKMSNSPGSFLAAFFIPTKHLHLLGESYYPQVALGSIPDKIPFFLASPKGCHWNSDYSNGVEIPGMGCLYDGLPVLHFGQMYSFTENLPFLEAKGLSQLFFDPPPKKQWTHQKRVILKFYTSKEQLLKHPRGYFAIEAEPYKKWRTQVVDIKWGAGRHKKIEIGAKVWIHLPYTLKDWKKPKNTSSKKLREIKIQFYFPNAISPHQLNTNNISTDPRALNFIQFYTLQKH